MMLLRENLGEFERLCLHKYFLNRPNSFEKSIKLTNHSVCKTQLIL